MRTLIQSWLFAWLFVLGLSLGSLANLMIHALTGGRWGDGPRPAWRAAARLLPVLALLFVPIAVGHSAAFIARAIACFAIWITLAWAFLASGSARLAAGGLVAYALTMTLAAFDWIAALTPGWHSSGFGLVVGVGQMLAGMAFGVAATAMAAVGEERRDVLHDLGNLLLMYVLTWAYLAYTEFLIIWAADLPKEIEWFVPRLQTGWSVLGVLLVAFHFLVPFLVLLSRAAKRSRQLLGTIAIALLVANLADNFWLVMPSLRPQGPGVELADAAAPAVVLLAWGWLWRRGWKRECGEAQPGVAHG